MPTFAELWSNHPTIKGDAPLLDTKVYENQCAINMSASLMRSGIDLKSFTGARSWEKDKPKYPIPAEELAGWLDKNAALLPGEITKFSGKDVLGSFDKINGKTEVIFLKDYYGPGQSGDHIDLFSKNRMTPCSRGSVSRPASRTKGDSATTRSPRRSGSGKSNEAFGLRRFGRNHLDRGDVLLAPLRLAVVRAEVREVRLGHQRLHDRRFGDSGDLHDRNRDRDVQAHWSAT
ncbi:T6SS effector amidase Tae4 family protein [Roseateles sp. 22389]|uniref:T6SS effector amidase Tae4 family protein n=1 Tax=Roseateles sp. 22389 TaxID=3453916 RepID=UPI003F84D362